MVIDEHDLLIAERRSSRQQVANLVLQQVAKQRQFYQADRVATVCSCRL